MPSAQERRRNQRFPLKVPIQLAWRASEGEKRAETMVDNISSSGVYFYLPEKLQREGKVEFFVRLQSETVNSQGVLLHCLGSIIRVDTRPEAAAEGVGVAVRIDRYRFLREGERGSEETAFNDFSPE